MRALLMGSLVLLLSSRTLAVDVTTCGQVVPERDVGVLVADLDCTGQPVGVTLGPGAVLDMNGNGIANASDFGVQCLARSCRVEGPGEISGVAGVGIGGTARRAVLRFLDIHHNGTGVSLFQIGDEKVTARQVNTSDNAEFGISAGGVSLYLVNADRNGLAGVSVIRTVKGRQVSTSDNGTPGSASFGIIADAVRLDGLAANDNVGFGVFADKIRLRNSTVTGNNGLDLGIDLAAARRPSLRSSSCGRSQQLGIAAGVDWDVCAND
jgi:hypothetical protein